MPVTHPTSSARHLQIALVSTQQHWHGGEHQAALLAEGLRHRGHRCTILARADGEFSRRMRAAQFEVFEFPHRGRSPFALWSIRKIVKQLRPDILHANDGHALTAMSLASLGLPIPLRVVARRVDFPIRSVHRYRRFTHGLICVSNAVEKICRDAGLASERLAVVHDGVDPGFARSGSAERGRSCLAATSHDVLLLTIAKLTDHKGHAYLLRAIPRIHAQYPQARFLFAGDGELRADLERTTAQLQLTSVVQFLGYRHDIPDLLAAADSIVQPSHMEGLCSSLIDSMFAGKPIVATTAGGIPDLLGTIPGELPVAWQVPPRSVDELAEAILMQLGDADESKRRGLRAQQRAQARFTADNMVQQTLVAYHRFAAAHTSQRVAAQFAPRVSSVR